jgi:hypothetical protein
MASLSDEQIYERTVDELPFAEGELGARARYWGERSVKERIEGAHELMRRHYAKLGIDVDALRMDKTVVRFAPRNKQGEV